MKMDDMIPLEQVRAEQEARHQRHLARPALVRRAIDAHRWIRRTMYNAWSPRPWLRLYWRWQRSCRGWSDRDVWSLDRYLAQVVAGSVRQLRDVAHSYPVDMTPQEWEQALTRIIEPLEIYAADRFYPDESINALAAREDKEYRDVVEAMHELASVFGSLWD